jgi:hypothetical protein
LIVSASRLRAAVFGDTKFARSCDSAWVVRQSDCFYTQALPLCSLESVHVLHLVLEL